MKFTKISNLLATLGVIFPLSVAFSQTQNFFSEDFEGYSLGSWATQTGTSGWTLESNPVLGWQIESGNTPSSYTGPNNDHTKGNISGSYLYAETSSGAYLSSFITSSPTIDLSSVNGATLQLYVHRLGATIGDLEIKVSGDGGLTYKTVQKFSGQRATKPEEWEKVEIALSDFDGNSQFKFQFDYTSGSSFTGDIAFDDILIFGLPVFVPVIDSLSLENAFDVSSFLPRFATTTINGAHHRLLIDSALDEDGWHSWTTGDFAYFDDVDVWQSVGEVGLSRGFLNDQLRLGLGAGYSTADQNEVDPNP